MLSVPVGDRPIPVFSFMIVDGRTMVLLRPSGLGGCAGGGVTTSMLVVSLGWVKALPSTTSPSGTNPPGVAGVGVWLWPLHFRHTTHPLGVAPQGRRWN